MWSSDLGAVLTAAAYLDRINHATLSEFLSLPSMSISIYAFELPTTGSLSYSDHVTNGSDVYATQISAATQARANLRAVLKESRHTDGDKDYLRLVKVRHIIQLISQGRVFHLPERLWRSTSRIYTLL